MDTRAKAYLRFGLVSGLTVLDCGGRLRGQGTLVLPRCWPTTCVAGRTSRKPIALELFKPHGLQRRRDQQRRSPAQPRLAAQAEGGGGCRLPTTWCRRLWSARNGVTWLLTVGTYGRTASIYNLLSQARSVRPVAERGAHGNRSDRRCGPLWRDSFFACGVSAKDINYIAPAMLPDSFLLKNSPMREAGRTRKRPPNGRPFMH